MIPPSQPRFSTFKHTLGLLSKEAAYLWSSGLTQLLGNSLRTFLESRIFVLGTFHNFLVLALCTVQTWLSAAELVI